MNFSGLLSRAYMVRPVVAGALVLLLASFGLTLVAVPASAAASQLTGTVFNDYDHDGVKDAEDVGVGSVKIYAYDDAGTSYSATTAANGTYTIATGSAAGPLRVEMAVPSGYESSRIGTNNKTSVQIVPLAGDSSASGVDFAVEQPGDYCQNNPTLCTTVFPWAVSDANKSYLNNTGLLSFSYSQAESYANASNANTTLTRGDNTGALYGIASDPVTGDVFTSSYLRRKAPFLTDNGVATIYRQSGSTFSTLVNLNTLFSNSPGGANPHPKSSTTWINDSATADLIGKRGLGDLEASHDGRLLYVVGLNDRKVYQVPTTKTSALVASDIKSFAVPTTVAGCAAADVRPFGLGMSPGGVLHVGAVCSGESETFNDAANDKLRYYVWTLDPAGNSGAGAWTMVLNADVDNEQQIRRNDEVNIRDNRSQDIDRWNAWHFEQAWADSDRKTSPTNNNQGREIQPQPMLSDIEFDGANLILGIRDRYGDQVPGNGKLEASNPYPRGLGDTLQACAVSGGGFVIEGAAGCSHSGTEYFNGDDASDSWEEGAMGALVNLPLKAGVLSTSYDPRGYTSNAAAAQVNNRYDENGVINLKKSDNGGQLGSYAVYNNSGKINPASADPNLATNPQTYWGKANGLGDLEALCDSAPLEVGNLVWRDLNGNGIQDPSEAGISGVTVQLVNSSNAVVGTAITDGAGAYRFTTDTTQANASSSDSIGGGLKFREGFTVRVGKSADYQSGGKLFDLVPTKKDVALASNAYPGQSNAIDSDATVSGTGVLGSGWFPGISISAADTNPGENDHTLDTGFVRYVPVDLALTKKYKTMTGSYVAGNAAVTFDVTVINQTSQAIKPVRVVDYIDTDSFTPLTEAQSTSLAFSGTTSSSTVDWVVTGNGSAAVPSITIPELAASESVTFSITLQVAAGVTAADSPLVNNSEISYYDTDGNPANGDSTSGLVYDVDSIADSALGNDGAVEDDETAGKHFTNTGVASVVNTSGVLDEDDHDVASVPLYDLALSKSLADPNDVVGAPYPDQVPFVITVTNEGENQAYEIVVEDLPGAEMTIDTAATGSLYPATIASDASNDREVAFDGADQFTIDTLESGESVEFTVLIDITPATLTTWVNQAHIWAFDNDADGDNTPPAYVQDVDSTPNNLDRDPFVKYEDDEDDAEIGTRPLAIGSTLFLDTDGDNEADDVAGEGILVELLDAADEDAVIGSTETDSNGDYWFTNVKPGTYKVGVPADQSSASEPSALAGYASVPGASTNPSATNTEISESGSDAANDDGVRDIANGWTAVTKSFAMSYEGHAGSSDSDLLVVPTWGDPAAQYSDEQANLNIDFVFTAVPTYRVGNLVWEDLDNDGVKDASEDGIDDVTVDLRRASDDSLVASTSTDDGAYVFEGLDAGEYYVEIPASQFDDAAVLEGLRASTGAGFESDADSDGDNNANGLQAAAGAKTVTNTFTLGADDDIFDASEPTDETDSDSWAHGDARSNLSIDLGFYQPLRLGSLVWLDNGRVDSSTFDWANEDNGLAEDGEFGIDDVDVNLWRDVDGDGVFEPAGDDSTGEVGTVTSNEDGTYVFDGLDAGQYFVRVDMDQDGLDGLRPSTATRAATAETDDDDNDGALSSGYSVSGPIVLNYGTEPTDEAGDFGAGDSEALATAVTGVAKLDYNSQLEVDFGFSPVPGYRIGNLVWSDFNNDGAADSGEPGIPGVTVQLQTLSGAAVVDLDGDAVTAVVTDQDGHYVFDNLPAGTYRAVISKAGANAAVLGGAVTTDDATAGEPSVDNDNNGSVLTSPAGWTSGAIVVGDGDDDHSELTGETLRDGVATLDEDGVLRDDRSNLSVDFGFYYGLRLGNLVFRDQDGNATAVASTDDDADFDSAAGEVPLSGLTVQLFADNGDGVFDASSDAQVTIDQSGASIGAVQTDATGNYLFEHLRAAKYFVVIPSGGANASWSGPALSSTGTDLTDNGDHGTSATEYVAVSNLVTLAVGAQPTGEQDDDKADLAEELANAGSSHEFADNNSNLTVDLGLVEVPVYRIGNKVWYDRDDDGKFTAEEAGIAGVVVELRNTLGSTIDATVTDADGYYSFENLVAGGYRVYINLDQQASFDAADTDGWITTAEGDLFDADALANLRSSSVDVYSTDVQDGDNDDNGIATNATVLSAEIALGGAVRAGASEPTDETTVLEGADEESDGDWANGSDAHSNFSVDFGFSPLMRVGSTLWLDNGNGDPSLAENGVMNDDEPVLAGVRVQLLDGLGDVAQTTTTDANGHYLFEGVAPGAYSVAVPSSQPSGSEVDGRKVTPVQVSTAKSDGVNDGAVATGFIAVSAKFTLSLTADAALASDGEGQGVDSFDESDANALGSFDVADALSDLTVDFGFVDATVYRVGNMVYVDANNNGALDLSELGIAGVRVELYSATDGFVKFTTTSATGHYYFDGLVAGDYYVVIPDATFGVGTNDVLDDYFASTTVIADPDATLDDDNLNVGVETGGPVAGAAVRSGVFTLGSSSDEYASAEPEGETDTNAADQTLGSAESAADAAGATYADGRSDLTVDFAFYPALRLGSKVFLDNGIDDGEIDASLEDDGKLNGDEAGIANVTVQLFQDVTANGLDASDPLVTSTVTNAIGDYYFTSLRDDVTYIVVVANAPTATRNSTPTFSSGTVDNRDTAAEGTYGVLSYAAVATSVTMSAGGMATAEAAGEEALADSADASGIDIADNNSFLLADVGFSPVPTYELGNRVWWDDNDNGVFDSADESGIAGITVELRDGSGAAVSDSSGPITAVTDSDGEYRFADLVAGDYRVFVASGELPADIRPGGASVASPNDDVDSDNNAVANAGLGGFATGVVTLGGAAGPADHNEPVDEDEGDEPGTDIRDDRSNLSVDLGFTTGLRIGNVVWLDEGAGDHENNGLFDADEAGIVGLRVELWRDADADDVFSTAEDTFVAFTTTGAEGTYYFSNLEDGDTYFVAIEEVPDYDGNPVKPSDPRSPGAAPLSVDNDNDGATLGSYLSVSKALKPATGEALLDEADVIGVEDGTAEVAADAVTGRVPDANSYLSVDFGFMNVPLYRIGNLVWKDWNNNGIAEAGEDGIEGVLVQLLDDTGAVIAETVTDEDGGYVFTNLAAGSYSVFIPANQVDTGVSGAQVVVPGALSGFYATTVSVADANNENNNDSNAIVAFDPSNPTTQIGWRSSQFTVGERGDDEPTGEESRTDDDTVEDNGQATFRIDDDRSDFTVDFGFYSASVGNQIWIERDNVGVYDVGVDVPVVGVSVQLIERSSGAVVQTTTTDADGLYLFTGLIDGTEYRVKLPASNFASGGVLEGAYGASGEYPTYDADGRDRGEDAPAFADIYGAWFTTDAGSFPTGEGSEGNPVNDDVRPDTNSHLYFDFAFYSVEVGGVLGYDEDNSGHLEADETRRYAGVTLRLYNADGSPVIDAEGSPRVATSAADGSYLFTGLPNGDYYIEIPASYFAIGDILQYTVSSTWPTLAAAPGNREGSTAFDPDDDETVLDDNGYPVSGDPYSKGAVRSLVFTLGADTEPTTDPESRTGQSQDFSNMSIDFLVFEIPPGERELLPGDIVAQCVGDIPWLNYSLQLPEGFTTQDAAPLTITFKHPTDPSQNHMIENQPLSGEILWPGASATEPLQWPGWEQLADGSYVETDGNYAWTREGVEVLFKVNPEYTVTLQYPPATPECATSPQNSPPTEEPPAPAPDPSVTPDPDPTPAASITPAPEPTPVPTSVPELSGTGADSGLQIAAALGLAGLGALMLLMAARRRRY
ncbi:SdrD B-like domain-containing protein [Demequina oxidasica]|uniref:SdrD B-like domain-containing protein n=1 Tax=Demequina oxidasica TaxID=676199 RepID=UPI0007820560|nr:SdrD B-like domain-containing protein [Demequina oxidasica]